MPVKIAGCVILFNPDQFVEQNIDSYINHVETIYVINNTESDNNTPQFLSAYRSKTVFIRDGNNEGIAKRLNQACTLAIQNNFEYLLTMDQDSYFDESSIAAYIKCIENFDEKERVAMFGLNYQNQIKKTNCNFKKANSLITSGSVINLHSFKSIGSFDEALFIDFVDTEYCFRSIQKSYTIIEFTNIYMHHNLGEISEQRSLKNLKKSKRSFHSSIRLYYMIRNFLYVNSKYYKQFKMELAIHRKDLVHEIKNNLLYRTGRIKTLRLLMKAWKDFKNNHMGKQHD